MIKSITVIAVLSTMPTTAVLAGTMIGKIMNNHANAITISASNSVDELIPPDYAVVQNRKVTVDGEQVELIRYEREDGRSDGIGGEHFSLVLDELGKIKGFTRMDAALAIGELPSRDDARVIAIDFLKQFTPDLLATMKLSWVEPHDEPIQVTRNGKTEKITLTGMKVKMRNTSDGLWFWVIVGSDRKVMVFERDIVWITFPGHRKTEKWLHDSWVIENGLLTSDY